MRARIVFAATLVLALSVGSASGATSQNGRIVFARLARSDQIFTMAPDGTDLVRLTRSKMPNQDPTWSPDGTQIAFVRANRGWNGSKLMLMLSDGSGKSVVIRTNADVRGPDWFPDGAHIVMCRDRNGIVLRTRLLIAASDGSSVTAVGPRGASEPSVSPDGTKIIFTRFTRETHWNVWMMNVDGSGLTQITTDGRSMSPAWSPDGSQIVFVQRLKSPKGSQADVFIMSADGTNRTRLTETPRWEYAPTWSPDGSDILFMRTIYWDQYSSTDLWTIMPDGSNATELLHSPGVWEISPDWQAI